jgi:hypothetical protein
MIPGKNEKKRKKKKSKKEAEHELFAGKEALKLRLFIFVNVLRDKRALKKPTQG